MKTINESEEEDQKQGQNSLPEENLSSQPASKRVARTFNFWRGLQTTVGAAFIVATLFTLWTPGSLVTSGLDARMAEALQSASGEELAEAESVENERSDSYNRIGIVAGHYGSDAGSVCADGLTEVEMNLEIATLVQKELSDQGYEVNLLEEFDERLQGYQGAVLVSIHLDSCEYVNDQATGFKVAAALAAQDVAESQRLTACLSQRYTEITGLPYHAGSVTDDMTYYHAFSEIDPQTTAAIIEAGFLNRDYRFITEDTDRIAEGIVAGILCFVNNEPLQATQSP